MSLRRMEVVILAIGLVTIVFFTILSILNSWWFRGAFPDLNVYIRAAESNLAGIDAYTSRPSELPFVYHPIVLALLSLVHSFVSLSFVIPILLILVLSWGYWEVYISLKTLDAQSTSEKKLVFPIISPLVATSVIFMIGVTSVYTGNITPILHFAIIASFLRTIRKIDGFIGGMPILLVGALSIFKPYLLSYILFFAFERSGSIRSRLVAAFLSVTIFAILWSTGMLFMGVNYEEFTNKLMALNSGRQIGKGFYALFSLVGFDSKMALVLHFGLTGGMVIFSYFNRMTFFGANDSNYRYFSILYLIFTLVNPRLQEYDLFPALFVFMVYHMNAGRKAVQIAYRSTLFFAAIVLCLMIATVFGVRF